MKLLAASTVARIVVAVAGVLIGALAFGNVGVPGPIMHFGASMSVSPLQWVAVTMTMCILIEAAVFLYSGQYRRPFLASVYANVLSMLAGFPLAFLGAFDPTWFIAPTILSIIIELLLIRSGHAWFEAANGTIKASPIFWGNVLTNAIMLGLLLYAVKIK